MKKDATRIFGWVVAVMLIASGVYAQGASTGQPQTSSAARADALFQDGKRLMDQGQYEVACSRLAESEQLQPTVSSLGLLAACHEQQGKLATAWREYGMTAGRAEAEGDDRAGFARDRARALLPRLGKLVIQLQERVPGTTVLSNGQQVLETDWGRDVLVDPGEYEIVVRAPKKLDFKTKVTMRAGERMVVAVQMRAQDAGPPKDVATQDASTQVVDNGLGARLPVGLVVGGLGLVGIGIGTVYGLSAMNQSSQSNTLERTCRTDAECQEGESLRNGAFKASTISTIGFGVGTVGVAIGALLLLWPKSHDKGTTQGAVRSFRVTPVVGSTSGGAFVNGRF